LFIDILYNTSTILK